MTSLIEMINELDGSAGRVLHDCEAQNRLEVSSDLFLRTVIVAVLKSNEVNECLCYFIVISLTLLSNTDADGRIE